ncbi:GerA spore germination protein [Ruminiclostridium cellulolyticum H10]|uniref:GerA spore germination protein n=2 Tax=Ruminiclostridium cellulolyticum TaxID=1521 RepID=B8I7B0_RUMCH|nr:GerA spore germination protein [Ruminiclostridium cellulolyticum H10]
MTMFKVFSKKSKSKKMNQEKNTSNPNNTSKKDNIIKIPKSIGSIKDILNQEFTLCSDFIIREVVLGKLNVKIIIASFDGFVDKKILAENIIEPIMQYSQNTKISSVYTLLKEKIISSGDLEELNTLKDSIDGILSGNAVLFVEDEEKAFKIGLKAPEMRAVEQPDTEISIKGSKEGFTENLLTNTTLIRRRIKNSNLKVESFKLGERTNTDIVICYIQGIAQPEIIDELKKRINKIKTDAILTSGYIEQFIQDGSFSLFPMVGNSEKPDKVAAKLLEGRIAIISDGASTVLTIPYLVIESIQAQEDYYGEFIFASSMRILRFIALLISFYLPALYVALISFHQTTIPFKLMLTMAAARQGIPFSAFFETLIMLFAFEILREAGLRMPRSIGQAVSIVGAIVLGDAAVSAGIASAPIVIVTALSGICSFIVPPLIKAGSIIRILMLISANALGFFGMATLTNLIIIYLCSKKSFGIPYLAPISPFRATDLKDSLIVVPIWAMFGRPHSLSHGQYSKRTRGKSFSTRRKQNG